jgi:cathepsin D
MAFPSVSNIGKATFFLNAILQRKVPSPIFGFYLAKNGSELHLGGTNSDLYSGPIEYHPVIDMNVGNKTETAHWMLGGAEVYANGKNAKLSFKTIIDSGTSVMYGPPAQVEKLYQQIKGYQALSSPYNGYFAFPCKNMPKISFSWDGKKEWTINEEE